MEKKGRKSQLDKMDKLLNTENANFVTEENP